MSAIGKNEKSKLCLFIVVLALLSIMISASNLDPKDRSPVFYLKIAKSIPRVGRSGRYDDFYLKASKNIPRIGRNDPQMQEMLMADDWTSLEDADKFSDSLNKRMNYIPSLDN